MTHLASFFHNGHSVTNLFVLLKQGIVKVVEITIATDHDGARFAGDASRKRYVLIVLQFQDAVAAWRDTDALRNLPFEIHQKHAFLDFDSFGTIEGKVLFFGRERHPAVRLIEVDTISKSADTEDPSYSSSEHFIREGMALVRLMQDIYDNKYKPLEDRIACQKDIIFSSFVLHSLRLLEPQTL